ncbi:MAG: energy transducer TonB [Bacteroidota bacterium]
MPFNKLSLSILLSLSASLCVAQEEFPMPEVPAEFPGGYQAFYYFVVDSLQYPTEAKEKRIEGKVHVQFVIDETGDLIDKSVKAVKSDNELLNQAAIDVVRKSPNWIPARLTKKGETVKQRIILPITFKPPSEKEEKKMMKRKSKRKQ